jgi:hypothetical protein
MPSSPTQPAILQRIRDRVSKQGWLATGGYLVGTALIEKTGLSIMRVYVSGPALQFTEPAPEDVLRSMEDLGESDIEDLRAYGGERLIQSFSGNFDRGYWCVTTRVGGRIGCVCWLTRSRSYRPAGDKPAVLIQSCFTLPQFRGKSLYSATLRHALACAATMWNDRSVFIESSVFNESSIRGIEKAGFEAFGTVVYAGGRLLFYKTRKAR